MMPLPNHHDIPEFATGGIIPASEAASGDSLPPWLTGCDYGYMMALAARREAAAELTRLGGELGLDDIPPDEAVALCREARRELAAEDDERRRIARRRPPHWAGDDDGR